MKKIVVLTGAGISAESGLRTFRDADGLWENHRVEEVASPEAWKSDPELVLRFYNERRRLASEAVPNAAHRALATLENAYDVQIITQNVDDLHERAGSTRVLHLHGELTKARSVKNDTLIYEIGAQPIHWGDLAEDGHQMRPHIVWFGESVREIERAAELTAEADIFVVIGTSLQVYPAAGLLQLTRPGIPQYLVNPQTISGVADHVHKIAKNATEGVPELVQTLLSQAE